MIKSLPARYLLFLLVVFLFSCSKRSGKPKVLVFSKTDGFHHAAIADGNAALMKLAMANDFEIDTTTNAAWFNEDTLRNYSAVVFLNTTGDVLNHYQEADFERYIQAGGGYVGIHAAADAEYHWGWYGRLVGAYFKNHPEQQEAVLSIEDKNHPSTRHLPDQWKRKDEWYNFKNISEDINVLITIDEKSYAGGENGEKHPMAWYHEYDGGRSFYTELGHTQESYTDSLYLDHLLGGIQYAIGGNKKLNYNKAKTERVPSEERFVKTVLNKEGLAEPTEMAILPNLDILVAQRRGELMRYSHETQKVEQVGFLEVYHNTGIPKVNAEEGFMGLTLDPDFENNHYVYAYYSPVDTSVNRLSRFEFKNDTLDLSSEKIVLQLYSQRQICCHTGGSLTFGTDNQLYLSTGDNSTPFNEPGQTYISSGYAPLDGRTGHEQYDARRSAGNTNDLRGKILRIKINQDGSYEIPEGNLFPKEQEKTKPEIYVMGNRNPYRISIDKKTGYLYWGEVGPDARGDSLETRGPRGYDEVNQARKAGFFGWPLFVGNNYAYHAYDYATGKSGAAFDPQKPINNSPNNTGLTELPPAQPAFIWYPYAEYDEFPQVGSGGRNALAGPVYYVDSFPKETRYPDYYNGKLFIYDWIRSWIKVVTMRPNGDFDKMEPFMEQASFSSPIDMEVGPDGKLYVLEYGKGWFSKNADAAISRLDYLAGNLPPKIGAVTVDEPNGRLPFTVTAKVDVVDAEDDKLSYTWNLGDHTEKTSQAQVSYTFEKKGEYQISVSVNDGQSSATSGTVNVYAGNASPEIDIVLNSNRSFYFPGKAVDYRVLINDHGNELNEDNLYIAATFMEGSDLAGASLGHQQISETIMGKNLMMASDCQSCHMVDGASIGPSFKEVAIRYKGKDSTAYLSRKIIEGGGGVWGEQAMPAHPTMKPAEAKQIVTWITSLAEVSKAKKSLPQEGKYIPIISASGKDNTVLALIANYTNSPGTGIKPLSASTTTYLRSSVLQPERFKEVTGFVKKEVAGGNYLQYPGDKGSISITDIDLSGISAIELMSKSQAQNGRYKVQVFMDDPKGKEIGSGTLDFKNTKANHTRLPISAVTDGKLHTIYVHFSALVPQTDPSPLLNAIHFVTQ